MSAFFFGPPGRQLFGYLHVPEGTPTNAVLQCAPWGAEYEYAHRALHFLARRLAARGSHVLRFDYSGTGDSWGHSTEGDLDQWVADAKGAAEELRAASGIERIDLVGLRLGASIAARAARVIPNVRRVVLWDPIRDGQEWLREHAVTADGLARDEVEVGNSVVTSRFIQQIRDIRPDTVTLDSAEHVLLLITQGASARGVLPESERMETVVEEQPAPWVEDTSIWTGQVPVQAVNRIADWLA